MELFVRAGVVFVLSSGKGGGSDRNEKKRKMDARVPRDEKHAGKGGKLMRQQVGAKLKQLYADVMSEPLPERFKELIDTLDAQQEWENPVNCQSNQDKHR